MYNRPTVSQRISPCTPMAQHIENKDHDKQKLPFAPEYPKVLKKPRTFKIILNSADRINSSTLTEATFYVRLPDTFTSDKLNLTVEGFFHAVSPNDNTNLEKYPWMVRLVNLNNPYSYGSATNSPTNIIAVCQSRNYVNTAQKDIGGATMVDKRFFDQPITIKLDSPYFTTTAAGGVSNPWTVVLNVYDAGLD